MSDRWCHPQFDHFMRVKEDSVQRCFIVINPLRKSLPLALCNDPTHTNVAGFWEYVRPLEALQSASGLNPRDARRLRFLKCPSLQAPA